MSAVQNGRMPMLRDASLPGHRGHRTQPESQAQRAPTPSLPNVLKRQAQLMKVFFIESDPEKWPGMETPQSRGDRFWCKRNAIATAALISKLHEISEIADLCDEMLLDEEIKAIEAEAERVIAAWRGARA